MQQKQLTTSFKYAKTGAVCDYCISVYTTSLKEYHILKAVPVMAITVVYFGEKVESHRRDVIRLLKIY